MISDNVAHYHGPTTSAEHRAPGHWLLASLGKKVLRPGGIELTRELLAHLAATDRDRIVELGPGMGRTAQLLLAGGYASYVGIEPDLKARTALADRFRLHRDAACRAGDARATGLPDASADVVVSEAMLTMHSDGDKSRIAQEVLRVLAPGGRWAIHEMSLRPDDIPADVTSDLVKTMSRTIKVGARPLTTQGWQRILAEAGFEVEWVGHNAMRLMEPTRIIADEGIFGALNFLNNLRRNKDARTRVRAMRAMFRRYRQHLAAIALVARKPA